MRPLRRVVLPAVTVLLAAACSPDLQVPPGAQISCGEPADCPEGLACRNGFCVSASGSDAVAPGVAPGTASVTPGVLRAGAVLRAAFDVTEPLQSFPQVRLDLGGGELRALDLDAGASAGLHYEFTTTARGDETEGRTALVTADLLDTAGNRAAGLVLGAVVHDFSAPEPSLASVTLLPGPGNPLARVAAATAGTEVVIAVVPAEPLGAAPAPALAVTGPGGAAIPFAYDAAASSEGLASFTATVGAGTPDGAYQAAVTWADPAGNAGTRPAGAAFTVRTSVPALLVDQAAVRFVRSPWGSATLEDLGAFTVPAGPFFGVAPAATLSGDPALPAGTFVLAGGRPLEKVRVWTDEGRGALLGDLLPVPGGWERRPLERRDTPAAWVSGVDDAGNESAAVRIAAGEWVATSNPPAGVPVHEVTATAAVSAAFAQSPVAMTADEVAATPGQVAAADDDGVTFGRSLTVASSPRWIASPTSAGEHPSARAAHRMAYDPLRRRVVLFAGSTQPSSSADPFDDTWEWDGARWTQVTPLGAPPPRREGHVLFYDARRGTVVLFGGGGAYCLDDLWEWDGARWRPVPQAPAAPRPNNCGGGAGTYDPDRAVLFYWHGEPAEVWTWDGTGWTQEPGGGSGPSARRFADVAYDPVRRAVVMYGGWSTDWTTWFAETWEWDGAWHLRNGASAPGGRRGHRLAWDPVRGQVVLSGGQDSDGTVYADLWAWNGADWVDVTPAGAGPGVRTDHALAWDDVTGRLMLVCGEGNFGGLRPADTWHLGSAGWVALPTSFARPGVRKNHAMAADPAGGALLFGGVRNNSPLNSADLLADTWRYRAPVWTQLAPAASPARRVGHAMAGTATGVALFGGTGDGGAYLNDLHLWNGTTWVPQATSGSPPGARTGAGLAWDAARSRLVLFGGSNGGPLGDVFELSGTTWTNRTPGGTSPQPAARAYHGMVYDEAIQRVIVFGGCRNPVDGFARCGTVASPDDIPTTLFDDVWAWDGTAWTELSAGTGLHRGSFASAWSPPQRRAVTFGGYDGWNSYALPAEWDGRWWASVLDTGAPATLSAAMAFDATSGRPVLFGGDAGSISAQSWEWDAAPGRQPAVQLTVSTLPAGLDPATVEEVRVRASCGGLFAPYAASSNGAALWGWSQRGGRLGLGGWVPLAKAAGGVRAGGGLATPGASRLEWTSASPDEARRFLLTSRALAAFQCRPDGPAVDPAQRGLAPAQGAGEAVVAADYLEVRIRYAGP